MELDTTLVWLATGILFDLNSVFIASCRQAVAQLKAHLPTPETWTAGLRASLDRAQLLTLKAAVKKIRRSSSRHCLSFPWELLVAVLLPFTSAWAEIAAMLHHACTRPCTSLVRVPALAHSWLLTAFQDLSRHCGFTWWPLAPSSAILFSA